jgi:hypothetical protein
MAPSQLARPTVGWVSGAPHRGLELAIPQRIFQALTQAPLLSSSPRVLPDLEVVKVSLHILRWTSDLSLGELYPLHRSVTHVRGKPFIAILGMT